jgi:hypothetical protein
MFQMYSLTELAQELERREAAKVDYLADTRSMFLCSNEQESQLDLLDVASGLAVNELAHDQIATYLGIPLRYYRRLRSELPALLDENVNRLLRFNPQQRMVRTLDGKVRAFLSDRYRELDNYQIAQAVLPVLGDIPGVRIESCALTDRRMYIKAVTPRVAGEVKVGDEVCAGVVISNSEVGQGSLTVQPMVFRLICLNGMTVGQAGEGMMRQVHLGRRRVADEYGLLLREETRELGDRAFLAEVTDVVRAAVDEVRFRDLVAAMQQAASSEKVENPVAAVQVLARREGLAEREAEGVLRYLAEGGDLSRWGVLNAVTRAAQDVSSYDRASELEALGGRVLFYGFRNWQELATAS